MANFHIALLNMLSYMSWHMPGCIDGYIHAGGSDAAAARNHTIDQVDLDKSDYCCFIDSDMGFPPWALEHLLHHEKKVVTGVGFQKHEPYKPCIYKRNGLGELHNVMEFDIDSFFEIDATGAAFLLVSTDIIKKIGATHPGKWFEWMPNRSEDLEFSARIHDVGEKIWVDTSVLTDHYTMAPRGIADFTAKYAINREGRGEKSVDRKGKEFDPVAFRRDMIIPEDTDDSVLAAISAMESDEDFGEEVILVE